MPYTFEAFTHNALNVINTMENSHTLFLPHYLSPAVLLVLTNRFYVAFESIEASPTLFCVSKNGTYAECQKKVQRRKERTILTIVDGSQWSNTNDLKPLKLFIRQSCPKSSTDGDEKFDSEM